MTKSIRLIYILEQLSKKPKVCVKELAFSLNESLRVIQQDFETLKKYFGERLNKEGECYFLLKQEDFYDLFRLNHKTSKQFLKFLSIVDVKFYRQFKEEHGELIKALKLDSSAIYQIENSPYENLKAESLETLELLESAIANKTYMTITHHKPNEESFVFKFCQVLRILYLEDNWYIALNSMNDERTTINNGTVSFFRLMRISFIEKVILSRVEPKQFHSDNIDKLKAEKFLHYLQTPFSKIHNTPYPVLLKISAFASTYFHAKQYLKTQRFIQKLDNGESLFEFMITDDMEIMPIIQQWIPHLRVSEPLRIKEKIEENMKLFMKGE